MQVFQRKLQYELYPSLIAVGKLVIGKVVHTTLSIYFKYNILKILFDWSISSY